MSDDFSRKIFESLRWLFRWLFDLEIKREEWQCRVTIHDYSCGKLQLKLVFESTDGIIFHHIEPFFRYAMQAKILHPDTCSDLKQASNSLLEWGVDFGRVPALTKNMASTVETLKQYGKNFIQDILLQLFKNIRCTREHGQSSVTGFPGYHMGVPQLYQVSDRDDSDMFLSFIKRNDVLVVREVAFSQAAKIRRFEINGRVHCPRISRLEMRFLHAQMSQKTHTQKKNGLTASKSKNKDSKPSGTKQNRKFAQQNNLQERSPSNSERQAMNSIEIRSENASRGLRSNGSDQDNSPFKKMQEVKKDSSSKSAKNRKKKKKKKPLSDNESQRNEYDRALGRLKGQLSRFRQEQALIMAYDAEGWRGASREKIKPHAEIIRAKEAVERCKEIIRDCVRICDHAQGDKPIPKEYFDSEGELDFDRIFCSKCLKSESSDDNDIILCDGLCDRAYHMKCVIPSLDLSILEDEDGWLCPACDRKIDMIDEINDEFGTDYEYEDPWTSILIPGRIPRHKFYDCDSPNQQPGGNTSLFDMELPSDEESDSDYKAKENSSGADTESNNGSGPENSSEAESGSCVSEDISNGIQDVDVNEMFATIGEHSSDSESPKILEGKRKRLQVDYKALNKELFGDVESPELKVLAAVSDSDEDDIWSPSTKKRRS